MTLRGNVAYASALSRTSGMRIRDLIPEKEALITPEYYRRQNLSVRAPRFTRANYAPTCVDSRTKSTGTTPSSSA